jgi:SAM-dependent methyltransferase
MSALDRLHGNWIHHRRIRVLAAQFAKTLPPKTRRLLDVGCGDGSLALAIQKLRPDIEIHGLDVYRRPNTAIPVTVFDGFSLPFNAKEFDVVMFADVLHHTTDPHLLMREALRVAQCGVAIKDHVQRGFLERKTLTFMDWVGNARHGVALPYNYWSPQQWQSAFESLKLKPTSWLTKLGLYPFPANLLFERSLHFVALLQTADQRDFTPPP